MGWKKKQQQKPNSNTKGKQSLKITSFNSKLDRALKYIY